MENKAHGRYQFRTPAPSFITAKQETAGNTNHFPSLYITNNLKIIKKKQIQ